MYEASNYAHHEQPSTGASLPPEHVPPPFPGIHGKPCTRWSWSTYPNAKCPTNKQRVVDLCATSRTQQTLPPLIVPLACLYAPFHSNLAESTVAPGGGWADAPHVHRCGACSACLHHYCPVDMDTMSWVCTMCRRRNALRPEDGASVAGRTPPPETLAPTFVLPVPVRRTSGAHGGADPGKGGLSTETAEVVFLLVLDVCLPPDELEALKSQVQRVLPTLPTHARVGLITFGEMVHVWELGKSTAAVNPYQKCYSLQGNRAYREAEVRRYLGLTSERKESKKDPSSKGSTQCGNSSGMMDRFLIPLEDAEFALTGLIEELKPVEVYPYVAGGSTQHRPLRCTGSALQVASHVLSIHTSTNANATTPASSSSSPPASTDSARVVFGRILLFVGGPCTKGPGSIVATDRSCILRSQKDLTDGVALPMLQKAADFYASIARRLVERSIAADILIGSLDQVGLLEMSVCANSTGGMMLDTSSFASECFRESIGRAFFQRRTYYNVSVEVLTSPETLVCGMLGPAHNAGKASAGRCVSPYLSIGLGGSSEYFMCVADESTTLALYFDTAVGEFPDSTHRYIQIRATYYAIEDYQTSSSSSSASALACRRMCHVTTIVQRIARTLDPQYYLQCGAFDQEVAAVLTARQAVHLVSPALSVVAVVPTETTSKGGDDDESKKRGKGNHHQASETYGTNQDCSLILGTLCSPRVDLVRRWLDGILVRLLQRFSSFTPNVPDSVRPHPSFSLFPSFLYHLRRSEFFQILNLSPDERVYKVQYLHREGCEDCLAMVQPTLTAYSCEYPEGRPVPLDATSVQADCVLLLDSFFEVVIHNGTTVVQWMGLGYHTHPEYPNFARAVHKPHEDARALLAMRFPYPTYRETEQHGSQARFLLRHLNPSQQPASSSLSHANTNQSGAEIIHTDDASMASFYASLKSAIVRTDASAAS